MKKLMIIIGALASATVVGCMAGREGAQSQSDEKAKMPGKTAFDERFEKGLPQGWDFDNALGMVKFDIAAHEGFKAVRITGEEKFDRKKLGKYDQTILKIESPLVAIKPGQDFAVVVEAVGNVNMTSPVTRFRAEENKLRSFLPATAVMWYDAAKKPMLAQDPTGAMLPIGSSFGFKSMEKDFAKTLFLGSAPKGAAFARVRLGGEYPYIIGDKWLEIRRVALTLRESEKSAWDFGDVKAPKFERVSPSPSADIWTPFKFTIKDESEIAKVKATLNGQVIMDWERGAMGASRPTSEIAGGLEFTYKPTTPWTKGTLYRMTVEATDAAGNSAKETLAYYCGEPMPGVKWSLRDDGTFLKDGVPFFPIGTSGARKGPANDFNAEKLFAQLSEAGFNNVQCMYSYRTPTEAFYDGGGNKEFKRMVPIQEFIEYLNAAKRHNVNLYVEPARRDFGSEERVQDFVNVFNFFREHDVVSIWELADDMASHVTEDIMRDDANIVRAIDDKHIVGCSDALDYRGRFTPYAPSFDAINSQMYPFRNSPHEPDGLSHIISMCECMLGDAKDANAHTTLIPVIQAFSGWGLWKEHPSREEIRAQTFLAIIHGARGITYYTYFSHSIGGVPFASTPERLEDVFAVTRQMAAISKDLVSRDAKVQPEVKVVKGVKLDPGKHSAVTCLLKDGEADKGRLLIAASSLMSGESEVEIAIDGMTGAETLYEDGRAVKVENGVLKDKFAAKAVHIYRIK